MVDATKTLLLAAQQVCPPSSTLTDFLSQFVKTSGLMAGWQTTLPAAFEFDWILDVVKDSRSAPLPYYYTDWQAPQLRGVPTIQEIDQRLTDATQLQALAAVEDAGFSPAHVGGWTRIPSGLTLGHQVGLCTNMSCIRAATIRTRTWKPKSLFWPPAPLSASRSARGIAARRQLRTTIQKQNLPKVRHSRIRAV